MPRDYCKICVHFLKNLAAYLPSYHEKALLRARLGVASSLRSCLPHQDWEIPLRAFPRGTASKVAGLFLHCPFNAERQAGKL